MWSCRLKWNYKIYRKKEKYTVKGVSAPDHLPDSLSEVYPANAMTLASCVHTNPVSFLFYFDGCQPVLLVWLSAL
jgi:hypothetical protein